MARLQNAEETHLSRWLVFFASARSEDCLEILLESKSMFVATQVGHPSKVVIFNGVILMFTYFMSAMMESPFRNTVLPSKEGFACKQSLQERNAVISGPISKDMAKNSS